MADISSIKLPDGNTYDIKDASAVKTVNNTAPDANGNVSINTGRNYTAGNGINITNNVISSTVDTSDKVSKTGDTMTGNLNMKSNAITIGTAPSSSVVTGRGYYFLDSEETSIGYVRPWQNSEDRNGISVSARRLVNGTAVFNGIDLGIKSDGTRVLSLAYPKGWRDALGFSAGEGISLTDSGVITNTGLNALLRIQENVDLNTITDPGTYYVIASDATAATKYHYPNGTNGLLVVARTSVVMTRQFFFRVGTVNSNDHMWYSRENNSSSTSSAYGDWLQIWNSKSFDPSSKADASHTHGYINNDGTVNQSSVASGDQIVITDANNGAKIVKSNITFGSSTTTFLSNKGTWLAPTGDKLNMTLLWTNASPTSTWSTASIANSVSGASAYDTVYLELMLSTEFNHRYMGLLIPKSSEYSGASYGTYSYRTFRFVSSNGNVTVSASKDSSGTTQNKYLIPYRLWGVS